MKLPWPARRDRKHAISEAKDEYDQAVLEGRGVQATVDWLASIREANNFRIRFQSALER